MKLLSILFTLLTTLCGWSQTDFNNYRTLQSSGKIPQDFLVPTYQKMEQRITEGNIGIKNDIDQRVFLTRTMYPVDELLQSGYVVFGDPVSQHIQKIANQLLKNKPEYLRQLRFYTLKSDETNAFCTDQGIIFVTTGLISQLENDAQLAYVLAHEIVHYVNDHVLEGYSYSTKRRYGTSWVGELSRYSRDNETEADLQAVDLYKDAGFSKEELWGVFDILLYSYLPFDEVPIDVKSYFKPEADSAYIPDSFWKTKKYDIVAVEKVDDSKSSHPNIYNRKAYLKPKIEGMTGEWGTQTFITDETEFNEIRTIARFEFLRYNVLSAQYGEALYAIYILEKDFPNSIYLQRMKAQCWLGIYQQAKAGKLNAAYPQQTKWEGEIAQVYQFMAAIDKKNYMSFCIRYLYDLQKKYPDDAEIQAIYSLLIKEVAYDKAFELKNYSKTWYRQEETTTPQSSDSLAVNNKYKNIKSARGVYTGKPDSLNFYLSNIPDVVQDAEFLKQFEFLREAYLEQVKAEEAFEKLSPAEKRKFLKRHAFDYMNAGLNDMVLMQPFVLNQTIDGIDEVRSELNEETIMEAIDLAAEESGVSFTPVSEQYFTEDAIVMLNQRNILATRLEQMAKNKRIESFPVDYSVTKELFAGSPSKNVLFTVFENYYVVDFNEALLASSVLMITVPFVIPTAIPTAILQGNNTMIYGIVVNMETGEIVREFNERMELSMNKYNTAAKLYQIFTALKTDPSADPKSKSK